MTLGAKTVWEVGTGGSDTSGGGFNVANASMATDGAATSATGSSPVFTSATYNFVAGDVGSYLFIKSGTNWIPGWYKIASVATNAATLSAAAGAAVTIGSTTTLFGPSTAAGCATTASPTGATWAIDRSQQTSPQANGTNLTVDATTNTHVAPDGWTPGVGDVGNLIQITTTGTGAAFTVGFYEIVSISSGKWVLDRSPAATSSSGATWAFGGALLTIAKPAVVISNIVFVKDGTYNITSSLTLGNLGGGTPGTPPTLFLGYHAVRGDAPTDSTRPTINATTAITMIATNDAGLGIENFILTTSGATPATNGLVFGGNPDRGSWCANIKVSGPFSNSGIDNNGGGLVKKCQVTGMVSGSPNAAFSTNVGHFIIECLANGNTACVGFGASAGTNTGLFCVNCISVGNSYGFYSSLFSGNMINCIAHGNTNDGLYNGSYVAFMPVNCIFTENGGYGINSNIAIPQQYQQQVADYNLFYNNVSGPRHNFPAGVHDVLATGSPYVDASPATTLNFALNNTAGGGAAARGAGSPAVFPGGTLSYRDIGAAQHQDSGGSTTTIPNTARIIQNIGTY